MTNQSQWPKSLAQPAVRALASAGIEDLQALARHREESIRALHGIGPKALGILKGAMAEQGLAFVASDGSNSVEAVARNAGKRAEVLAEGGTPLPNIGNPARSALEHLGIFTLEGVTRFTQREALALHGVGPKAVRILNEALANQGLAFKDADS